MNLLLTTVRLHWIYSAIGIPLSTISSDIPGDIDYSGARRGDIKFRRSILSIRSVNDRMSDTYWPINIENNSKASNECWNHHLKYDVVVVNDFRRYSFVSAVMLRYNL